MLKRYLFLIIGLCIMAFGVAFSIKADLGTSPISSLPYVASIISNLSVGTATILMHCVFILLQILILRRNYDPIQLLQLAVAFIFGYMTDFAIYVMQNLSYSSYFQQWIFCAIGIFLVAVGVSFEVTAGVVTVAGEGLVLAICKVFPIKFGTMKVAFDITLVAIACLLSYLCLSGIYGVREGTLAAAIFVGTISRQLNKPLKRWTDSFFKQK